MDKKETNNGKRGGLLKGKPHYDKDGNSLGGIKAVVTDAGRKPVELEGGEVIINKEASKKHWKELSRINQSAGNGVPILPPDGASMDEDPEEYKDGGNIIEFNPNHLPNKWIVDFALDIKENHPEIWKLGGNIFGNEAFENLVRVRKRGHWLDSEEWMYIKWRSYVARHKKDFRIEGVIAMLKWTDTVQKGWSYMKSLIKAEIEKKAVKTNKLEKQGFLKKGGSINDKTKNNENKNRFKEKGIIEEAISYISRGIRTAEKEQSRSLSKNEIIFLEARLSYDFALKKELWFNDTSKLPNPVAGGGNENELYYDAEIGKIFKINNLFNNEFSILNYLKYLKRHNELFGETKYELFGFSNKYPSIKSATPFIQPIATQSYILGESPTESEIDSFMEKSGFEKIKDFTYSNDKYTVSDLRPRNLVKTENGEIFVIDNIISDKEKMARGGKTCATCDHCEVLDKDGKRAIDDKSLKRLTKCITKLTQTKDLNLKPNGQYTLARKKLHKKIINEFKENAVCITTGQPIAILMGGSPASGKSSFLKKYRPFLLQEEILKVDADEIRAKLPEYKGYNATQTHQETKDIVNTLISDRNIGVPCDFDLIYDGTMNNVRSYKPLIELLRSRNYKIFIVYMDKVPKEVVVERMKNRYRDTGRFVPLEVIDDFFQKGKSAFEELKPLVDGYLVIDGSNRDYDILEKGGMQLPKDRAYSKLGQKINKADLDKIEYKKGGSIDKQDSVELDVPLMIRIMELAREDIKSDKELHDVAERMIKIRNKGVLTMDDYDFIKSVKKKAPSKK